MVILGSDEDKVHVLKYFVVRASENRKRNILKSINRIWA